MPDRNGQATSWLQLPRIFAADRRQNPGRSVRRGSFRVHPAARIPSCSALGCRGSARASAPPLVHARPRLLAALLGERRVVGVSVGAATMVRARIVGIEGRAQAKALGLARRLRKSPGCIRPLLPATIRSRALPRYRSPIEPSAGNRSSPPAIRGAMETTRSCGRFRSAAATVSVTNTSHGATFKIAHGLPLSPEPARSGGPAPATLGRSSPRPRAFHEATAADAARPDLAQLRGA